MSEQEKTNNLNGGFIVFVDDMDGDVYRDWESATIAVTHAFENGAKSVCLQKFPK